MSYFESELQRDLSEKEIEFLEWLQEMLNDTR